MADQGAHSVQVASTVADCTVVVPNIAGGVPVAVAKSLNRALYGSVSAELPDEFKAKLGM